MFITINITSYLIKMFFGNFHLTYINHSCFSLSADGACAQVVPTNACAMGWVMHLTVTSGCFLQPFSAFQRIFLSAAILDHSAGRGHKNARETPS